MANGSAHSNRVDSSINHREFPDYMKNNLILKKNSRS